MIYLQAMQSTMRERDSSVRLFGTGSEHWSNYMRKMHSYVQLNNL